MSLNSSLHFSKTQAQVALKIAGLTQSDIAREFDVTPQAVHFAINNPKQSTRIAQRIEQLIQLANELLPLENLRMTG